jgi:tetratricopeptide (TPR) repeat protein
MRTGRLVFTLALAHAGGDDDAPGEFARRAATALTESRAALAAGRAADALAAAELGLEFDPDSRALLEAAARASRAAGRGDDELYWTWQRHERAPGLDPLATTSRELADRWDASVAAASAAALALAHRFAGERKPATVVADVPGWPGARGRETSHYVIQGDLDAATLDDVATALESVHRCYRDFFRGEDSARSGRRVTIRAYRSRAEFDEREPGVPREIHGFYSPERDVIALYDPREAAPSADGTRGETRPISAFWTTLFHEAAHPFLRAATRPPLPFWISEGSACLFEGCRLVRGGAVEPGRVPRARLRELAALLDAGRADLGSVVAQRDASGFPLNHYAVAWGLVDFCFRFEDEAGERPYEKAYRDFLESWRTADEKTDARARFESAFVERPKQAGVATFAAFEQRWRASVRELAERTFGGAEQADAWLALARRQAGRRQPDRAAASLRNALDLRPDDATLLAELAEAQLALDDKGGAVATARRALAATNDLIGRPDDPEHESAAHAARERAIALLTRADAKLAEPVVAANDALLVTGLATARAYAEAGFPRCALARIDEVAALLGGSRGFQELRAELVAKGGEPGRWRRLRVGDDAGAADLAPPGAVSYRIEALVDPGASADGGATDASQSFGGIVFGESEREGPRAFAVSGRGRLALVSSRAGWDGTEEFAQASGETPYRLAVEVVLARDGRPGRVDCSCDGRVVRAYALDPAHFLDPADFTPCAGAVASGAGARVTDLRWRR